MGEQLLEKLKENLDLGPQVQEKISSMLTKYNEMDDEAKAEFNENMKQMFKKSLSKYSSDIWSMKYLMMSRSYAILLVAIILILLIFAFFGYKLYKSLMERERKREEKKKLKQMKKKK